MNPTISIIMPTYNRGYIIQRAIDSIKAQTYKDYELIIIDDGSTDGTENIINSNNSSKIRYFKLETNKGANYARNYGMKQAKGGFFAFLDSDNVWLPKFLQNRYDALINNDVDFVFGRVNKYSHDKKSFIEPNIDAKFLQDRHLLIEKYLLFHNVIDTNTVCMKKKCWEEIGGFDENLKRFQDWEYFYRIFVSEKYKLLFLDNALVNNFVQKDSITKLSELYLDARLHILKKQLPMCRKYNCIITVIIYILFVENEYYGVDNLEIAYSKICSILSESEVHLLNKTIVKKLMNCIKSYKKQEKVIQFMEQWIQQIEDKNKIVNIFKRFGIHKLIIYGYGRLGKLLYKTLINSEIEIEAIVDRYINQIEEIKVPFYNICPSSIESDAIIITAITSYEEIKKELSCKHKDLSIICLSHIFNLGA